MLLVKSVDAAAELSVHYPVLVRADAWSDRYERVVDDESNLLEAVVEAMAITGHAAVFGIETTLGDLLWHLQLDTGHFSGLWERLNHPNFKKIVEYGDLATRYLLVKLVAGERHIEYYLLLRTLTGANPVSDNHRGYIDNMAFDWIQWGKDNGKLDQLAIDLLEHS